jgi:hypothetical protein
MVLTLLARILAIVQEVVIELAVDYLLIIYWLANFA